MYFRFYEIDFTKHQYQESRKSQNGFFENIDNQDQNST